MRIIVCNRWENIHNMNQNILPDRVSPITANVILPEPLDNDGAKTVKPNPPAPNPPPILNNRDRLCVSPSLSEYRLPPAIANEKQANPTDPTSGEVSKSSRKYIVALVTNVKIYK